MGNVKIRTDEVFSVKAATHKTFVSTKFRLILIL